ncbi:MAG: branched-chain amino acid ABC transporter permease [Lachnospiraceae bacterium]|nr:branched-chain amino acid ABC transporter permease [Lachnospiraceae bacterium]
MGTFLQLLLRSLESGSVYGMAAMGIIIVYRTNFMVNFAQGSMGMFGTFIVTAVFIHSGWPLALCILIGVLAGIGVGSLVNFAVIRHTKKISAAGKEIITLGMMMIFLGITPMLFGTDPLRLPKLIPTGSLSFGGADISYNSLFNIIFGFALMIIMFIMLQKSKLGLAIRATASNENTAKLMGIPTKTVTLFAWIVAMILGTFAGVMIAPTTSVTTELMDSVQLAAFIACIFGGFQTFYGPVVASYFVAIGSNLLIYYVSDIWGQQILYIIVILFLFFRPVGIFGKKVTKKV